MLVMDGVLYMLTNPRFAEREAVAIYSLRKVWTGPICMVATLPESQEVSERIMAAAGGPAAGCSVVRQESLGVKHSNYATKTMLPAWTPFDRTAFLDGDTITVGDITPLFDAHMTIVQFSNWISTGRKISSRINWWKGISPWIDQLVNIQLDSEWPAVNTGTLGWHGHGEDWAPYWHELAIAGQHTNLTDELAMQLLQPYIENHVVFDNRYNMSPFKGVNQETAIVWHFHGDKHMRIPAGKQIWLPWFLEAYQADWAGLKEWAGRWDPWIRDMRTKGELPT